jgi:hypothetical protein
MNPLPEWSDMDPEDADNAKKSIKTGVGFFPASCNACFEGYGKPLLCWAL